MSDIDYKQLAKEWFADINEHNLDVFDNYLTPNFVEHEIVPGIEGNGPEVPKQFFAMFLNGFPDMRMDLEDIVVDGDRICWRYRITGTHDGEFMGIPATGRKIDVQGFDMLRMEGTRAAEHWGVTDQLTMMQQLGLVPEDPPA